MINREDMLALTRRMTVRRSSMTRIAGGYMDPEGYIDGTFNIAFLKLTPADREKNLQIAKKIPFAQTNQNLKEYSFAKEKMQGDSVWKLLMGMRACGLKNDALMETFYEIAGEKYRASGDYAIYVFPAYMDGGAALNYVDVYQADQRHPHDELLEILGI